MIEMEKPRIEREEVDIEKGYGRFSMTDLERGYATTIGNSLRRIFLCQIGRAHV